MTHRTSETFLGTLEEVSPWKWRIDRRKGIRTNIPLDWRRDAICSGPKFPGKARSAERTLFLLHWRMEARGIDRVFFSAATSEDKKEKKHFLSAKSDEMSRGEVLIVIDGSSRANTSPACKYHLNSNEGMQRREEKKTNEWIGSRTTSQTISSASASALILFIVRRFVEGSLVKATTREETGEQKPSEHVDECRERCERRFGSTR